MLLRILLGLILGFLWEVGAVNYTRAVIDRHRVRATAITFGMGMLGLLPTVFMVYAAKIDVAFAFILGESLSTYICIGPHDDTKGTPR